MTVYLLCGYVEQACHALGWLVGWLAGWLAGWLVGWLEAQRGPERPREAQRGPERPSVDRTSLSCAWLAGWLVGWLAGWLVGWRPREAHVNDVQNAICQGNTVCLAHKCTYVHDVFTDIKMP